MSNPMAQLCEKNKAKCYQICYTDKYSFAASYINSTMTSKFSLNLTTRGNVWQWFEKAEEKQTGKKKRKGKKEEWNYISSSGMSCGDMS